MTRSYSKVLAILSPLTTVLAAGCGPDLSPAAWQAKDAWCPVHQDECREQARVRYDPVAGGIIAVEKAEKMTADDPEASNQLYAVADVCKASGLPHACAVEAKLRAAVEARRASLGSIAASSSHPNSVPKGAVECFGKGEIPNGTPVGPFFQAQVPEIPDINGDGMPDHVFKTQSGGTAIVVTTDKADCHVEVYRMNGYLLDGAVQVLPTKTNGWSDISVNFTFEHKERYVHGMATVQAVFDGTRYHWTHLTSCGGLRSPQFDPAIDCDWVFVTLNPDRDSILADREKESAAKKAQAQSDIHQCGTDIAACKDKCSKGPASNECYALAIMNNEGLAVVGLKSPNYGKSMALWSAGCAGGNTFACEAKDKLVEASTNCTNTTVGCEAFCNGGIGRACSIRGAEVQGAPGGPAAALWFQKGCDLGDGAACDNLGGAYFLGEGVPKNRVKAEELYRKACDIDNAEVAASHTAEPDPTMATRRETACRNYDGAVCVNKVQVPAHRRPDKDALCRRLPGNFSTAWSTLNGQDVDDCLNAMMNRGCQEVTGLKTYCCPSK